MMKTRTNGRGLRPLPRAAMAGLLLTLPLAACDVDSLLDVEDPAVATPESLANPSALPVLVAGAVGDFSLAWNGGQLRDTFTPVTALFTDEFRDSDTFTTRIANDQRVNEYLTNNTDLIFRDLQRARTSTAIASEAVRAVGGPNDPRLALLLSLEGYSILGLGEAFCSNVPLSRVVDGEFVGGAGLQTAALMDSAIAKFDAALAAVNTGDIANLARVGKGRALLNKHQAAAAAAAVAGVPTGFEYVVEYSENSSRQENDTWNLNRSNGRYTMANREGVNGLPFREVLGYDSLGVGFDKTTPLYGQPVYPERGSDLVLASGVEARLIEAEALHRAGNFAGAHAILESLAPARVPDAAPTTDEASRTLLFNERAYHMYLTGHRLGDLRRLVRNYGIPQEQVFPTGPYFKQGEYGAQTAFFVPFQEENNAAYDPDQCDVTEVPGQQ